MDCLSSSRWAELCERDRSVDERNEITNKFVVVPRTCEISETWRKVQCEKKHHGRKCICARFSRSRSFHTACAFDCRAIFNGPTRHSLVGDVPGQDPTKEAETACVMYKWRIDRCSVPELENWSNNVETLLYLVESNPSTSSCRYLTHWICSNLQHWLHSDGTANRDDCMWKITFNSCFFEDF